MPCELPNGIRLVYIDDRGRRRAIALDMARAVDFGQTRLFREPPAYRGSITSQDGGSIGPVLEAHQSLTFQGSRAGGRSQSAPPRRAASRPAAASARAAASRDMYAFVRGNVRSDV